MAAKIGIAVVWLLAFAALAAAHSVLHADATLTIDADLARASVFLDGGESAALSAEGRANVRLTSGQHVVELRCGDEIVASYELHAAGSASIPWIVRSTSSTQRLCTAPATPVRPATPSPTAASTSAAEVAPNAPNLPPSAPTEHPCIGTWSGRFIDVYGDDECSVMLTVASGDVAGTAVSTIRICGEHGSSRPLAARDADYAASFPSMGARARLSCTGPSPGRGYLSFEDGVIPLRRRGAR